MPAWKDVTSYSRSDKDRIPRSWQVNVGVGRIRVSVHRHIDYPPDVWLLTVPGIAGNHPLERKELNEALAEALAFVERWCRSVITDCENVRLPN